MKDRKGIARLALRTGTTIVPAYSFGNTAAAWIQATTPCATPGATPLSSFGGTFVLGIFLDSQKSSACHCTSCFAYSSAI